MGCNVYHVNAITITALSFILLLAVLGTSSMIKGCFDMSKAFAALDNMPKSQDTGLDTSAMTNMLTKGHSMSMCFGQGLIRESVDIAGISSVRFNVDPSTLPAYAYIAAGTLCIAVILCFTAMIILIMSTCGGEESYKAKTKNGTHTRTAMILLGVTVGLCLIGMTAYSIGSIHAKKNPVLFMAGFRSEARQSMMSHMGGGSNPFHRGKRDFASQMRSLGSQMLGGILKDHLLTISYGHSFILGWVSTALAFISLLLTGYARYNLIQQPYSSSSVMF